MAAQAINVQVNSPVQMESTVAGYIAQGFNVASRTPASVTMIKRKRISYFWVIIGAFLCVLPLFIYLIVYLAQSDQMVIINLAVPASASRPIISSPQTGALPAPQMGALPAPQSGAYYAQQAAAVPVTQTGALSAPRSPDGNYWWDGQQWRPISELQGSQPQGASGPYQQPGAQSGPNQQPGSASGPYQQPNTQG